MQKTLFENVDCVSFYVDNLDDGISFYKEKLGLKLLWRTEEACGLGMDHDITEVVLVIRNDIPVAQFKVESVDQVLPEIIAAGGKVTYGPFNIDIGRCAVICDPWKNKYCILDMTKGKYQVDEKGNVTGLTCDDK